MNINESLGVYVSWIFQVLVNALLVVTGYLMSLIKGLQLSLRSSGDEITRENVSALLLLTENFEVYPHINFPNYVFKKTGKMRGIIF
jgi:hypothetical protein